METIKSSKEISELFSHGKRIHTSYLTFIVSPVKQHGQKGRVAFIAGKKLGNAVWRNKAKRRMREIYKELPYNWEANNIVFLAKADICNKPYHEVLKHCSVKLNIKRSNDVL